MYYDIDLLLGRRLRSRRRLLGLSQKALAARCGVRFQQIQKYESAANKMSAVMIGRLAYGLEVPVAYFYEGLEDLMALRPKGTRSRRRASAADGAEAAH